MANERIEYLAFGKVWVIPEISTEQYNEATKVLERNMLGDLTNDDATRLLSIALVEKGTEGWTPEIGESNFELFKRFPMKARVEVLKTFFAGIKDIADSIQNAFESFVMKKSE